MVAIVHGVELICLLCMHTRQCRAKARSPSHNWNAHSIFIWGGYVRTMKTDRQMAAAFDDTSSAAHKQRYIRERASAAFTISTCYCCLATRSRLSYTIFHPATTIEMVCFLSVYNSFVCVCIYCAWRLLDARSEPLYGTHVRIASHSYSFILHD